MFLVNSRLGLLSAPTLSSRMRDPLTYPWSPFSRSYGGILPSSLTKDHPFALVHYALAHLRRSAVRTI